MSQDVAAALANRCAPLLPVREWGYERRDEDEEMEEDARGNQVLWLLARAAELAFGEGHGAAGWEEGVEGLLAEVERWFGKVPRAFRGLSTSAIERDDLPEVWFPVDAIGMV